MLIIILGHSSSVRSYSHLATNLRKNEILKDYTSYDQTPFAAATYFDELETSSGPTKMQSPLISCKCVSDVGE